MPNPIFLIDLDATTVDMTKVWLQKYNAAVDGKDPLTVDDLSTWDFFSHVKYPKILAKVLASKGFFYDLEPIKNSISVINKLLNKNVDIVFLTQLPRRSKYAAEDKRKWIKKYFPDFDQRNVIFAHRKELVCGNLLFDDNPEHLINWRNFQNKKDLITASIEYPYNKNTKVNWRFQKNKAWNDFYEKVCAYYNL